MKEFGHPTPSAAMVAFQDKLVFWAIALIPIQDFILKKTPLGVFGASISVLFILLHIATKVSARKILATSIPFFLILLVAFIIINNAYNLAVWGLDSGSQSTLYKMASLMVIHFITWYPVFFMDVLRIDTKKAILYATLIMSIGFLAGDVLRIPLFAGSGLFHAAEYIEPGSKALSVRWRSLTPEASTAGACAVMLLFLSMHFCKTVALGPIWLPFRILPGFKGHSPASSSSSSRRRFAGVAAGRSISWAAASRS